MDEKAREARRAYQRQWRRDNPEKVKQYQEAYWTRKAEQRKAAAAAAGDRREVIR